MWQHPFQKKNVGLKIIEKGICDQKNSFKENCVPFDKF
jgi:hypothetical protein